MFRRLLKPISIAAVSGISFSFGQLYEYAQQKTVRQMPTQSPSATEQATKRLNNRLEKEADPVVKQIIESGQAQLFGSSVLAALVNVNWNNTDFDLKVADHGTLNSVYTKLKSK